MRCLRCLVPAFLILLGGCAGSGDSWVELAGTRYKVELAQNDADRAKGLMFRDAMDEDRGMLFIHERQEPMAYWMKNTKIALDILYFDQQRRLVSQQRDVPPCSAGDACPPYPSRQPARYVLELNAGQAAKLGLKDGATLTFSPDIPTLK
ncbi:DUF192 domain-containing protein [Xanthomonas oryzae]|uniref:DUF192 domain-containing protein n=1 Tax=Xanthomonas oryzae pv. leersiae TaxID=3112258 RepID=A0AAJ6KL36_9XANT|nr:DUF192 domain-containing protein [Xanthomonas oryzae]WIX05998.1 DUF192 domain-containing protein [Xanthomonas oryzae pv. oryzae]QBG93078.1 DUF192 domain-containing protein [Xanthomonas oryzae]QBG95019.1 DUF192 domain-containing protein [Xanthomonas oryzae]QBH00933.1 DUF192 domain-containing protein [Xanthomonas oryzae]QBH02869.1 DUF192 domain-containing protein [Xanthomonas oryzae]